MFFGMCQLYTDHQTGRVFVTSGVRPSILVLSGTTGDTLEPSRPYTITPRTIKWQDKTYGNSNVPGDTLEASPASSAAFRNLVCATLDSKDKNSLFAVDQVNDAVYHINGIVTPLWRQVNSNPLSVAVCFPDMYILRDGGRTLQHETLVSGPTLVASCLPLPRVVSNIVVEYAFAGERVPLDLPDTYWDKLNNF